MEEERREGIDGLGSSRTADRGTNQEAKGGSIAEARQGVGEDEGEGKPAARVEAISGDSSGLLLLLPCYCMVVGLMLSRFRYATNKDH